jgi:ribbon-helix-helix CopG family protein
MRMRRTTVYLETETDLLLKREAMRRRRPVAELIREALNGYVHRAGGRLPPGIGAFDSGHSDTAERAEEILRETGFGEDSRLRGAESRRRKRLRAKR